MTPAEMAQACVRVCEACLGKGACECCIVKAITAFAEERVARQECRAEAWADAMKRLDAIKQEGIEIGRAEALEEAAEWAAEHLTHGNYEWVCEGIRALKSKS